MMVLRNGLCYKRSASKVLQLHGSPRPAILAFPGGSQRRVERDTDSASIHAASEHSPPAMRSRQRRTTHSVERPAAEPTRVAVRSSRRAVYHSTVGLALGASRHRSSTRSSIAVREAAMTTSRRVPAPRPLCSRTSVFPASFPLACLGDGAHRIPRVTLLGAEAHRSRPHGHALQHPLRQLRRRALTEQPVKLRATWQAGWRWLQTSMQVQTGRADDSPNRRSRQRADPTHSTTSQ